jgi:Zn-dependent protease
MSSASIAPALCVGCGNKIQSAALSCPACGRLTRASELQALSAQAQAAAAAGKIAEARDIWRRALALLPEDTLQHGSIQARIAELEQQLAVSPNGQAAPKNWWRKVTSALGPIGLMAWKFKALLLGLTKLGTLFSMFAFFGVYWALYGWAFALGLVLSIYIHEMGHVIEIRSYGLPASAPMFIPGLGAFIRLRTLNITPIQDARIGLAGPIYGLGAALLSLVLHLATGLPIFAVIAHFGATINLFNLIPVWQLDGSRGFHSLTQTQRGIILSCTIAIFLIAHQGMLFLIALGAGYRLFTKDAAQQEDRPCLIRYVLLLAAFALIAAYTPLK